MTLLLLLLLLLKLGHSGEFLGGGHGHGKGRRGEQGGCWEVSLNGKEEGRLGGGDLSVVSTLRLREGRDRKPEMIGLALRLGR